jgi:starvation-inducible DNA-binding protein
MPKTRSPSSLTASDRDGSAKLLNTLLADEFVLYTKTRNYHWNVTGSTFGELHRLFNEQYDQLNQIVDDVAERVRALGGVAAGSLEEFRKLARLKESPSTVPLGSTHMIESLLLDYEALIGYLRSDLELSLHRFHDAGTNNFLTDLLERHEKTAWMLRAHLEEGYR